MPRRLFFNGKIWLIALLITGLAAVHTADYETLLYKTLLEAQPERRSQTSRISVNSVDEVVNQYIKYYSYGKYRNVVDDSIFAFNVVIKKEPVKVAKPAPPPPPPAPVVKKKPSPPKVKPFTAQLEVTGIAITPERKLVMIWDKRKKESYVLLENEKVYKWKVVSIDSERVIMRHERGGRYEFIVNEDTLTNF